MRCNDQLSAVLNGKQRIFRPHGLLTENIQTGSGNLALVQSICQILFHHKTASGYIDQKGAFFHFTECIPVHQPFGIRIQRCMKRDHIGTFQKFLKVHPLIRLIRISSGSRIIDHMTAEGFRYGCHPPSDGSQTYNPPGLAIQL